MIRGPILPNSTKPTKENIKKLLSATRTKIESQKRIHQNLMNRDFVTTSLLNTKIIQAQILWNQIEQIKTGRIGPELQSLKQEMIDVLQNGIESHVITDLPSLARLEERELTKFLAILVRKRNGLSYGVIKELDFFKFEIGMMPEGEICAVCHDTYSEGQECIELECKHIFHRSCISKWLQMKRNCPLCKKSVRKAVKRQQNQPRDENVNDENVRGADPQP